MKKLKMKVVLDEGARISRAHETDAGLDLCARNDARIDPKSSATFDTGVHIALPAGTVGVLMSKSGLNVKRGITSEGVIDEGYTGSIVVKLYNNSAAVQYIKTGQKISQLLVLPCYKPEMEIVGELDETERGNNGFGSTGI